MREVCLLAWRVEARVGVMMSANCRVICVEKSPLTLQQRYEEKLMGGAMILWGGAVQVAK
jgi:hypothetical protein